MSKATDVLFVSHGGGPMPLLGDPGHQDMVDRLTELAADLRKPSAILVISAHWEEASSCRVASVVKRRPSAAPSSGSSASPARPTTQWT